MKDLKQLLKKKTIGSRSALDEKSFFVVFERIIREEYGKQGAKNLSPATVRNKNLAVRTGNQNWTSELLLNKDYILGRINEQLGGAEITDISIVR